MPKCKECDWWKLTGDKSNQANGSEKGRCLGRAPSATAVVMPAVNQFTHEVTPQIIEVTLWPTVGAACDACGDFKFQEKTEPLKIPDSLKKPLLKGPLL